MKIDRVELYRVAVPLRGARPLFHWPASHGGARPDRFYPSWIPGFPQTELRLYVLRLVSDDGAEGIAATPAMGTERDGLGPMLGAYLLGLDPEDRAAVNARIEEFSYLGLRNGWIESAFLDIVAKARGVPLWQLLGGTGGAVRPYWSTGATYDHHPQAARALVRAVLAHGFGAVKLRVKSSELARIAGFLAAARDEAGDRLELMVDCNQGWPVSIVHHVPRWSRAFAAEVARAAEALGYHWIEEPLHRGDAAGLAELRGRLTSLRVAGGELNASLGDYDEYLRVGALDVYQPDATLAEGTYSGGITLVERLLERLRGHARDARPPSYCPHTWTTGIGFLVNLHLVGLVPPERRHPIEYPIEGPFTPESWGGLLAAPPVRNSAGEIPLPTRPGLGAELDWAKVRRHGVLLSRASPLRVACRTILDRGPRVALELMRERGRAG
jgi:L-alanine-DL-glutamate epimerase-like enolase superfamily enzyme